jgi:hypothetical protein
MAEDAKCYLHFGPPQCLHPLSTSAQTEFKSPGKEGFEMQGKMKEVLKLLIEKGATFHRHTRYSSESLSTVVE